MSPNLIYKCKCNKTAVLRGKTKKLLKYAETRWTIGREGLAVSYWLETWWEMRPSGFHFYLGISQSGSTTL
jgi:hypothetical protein